MLWKDIRSCMKTGNTLVKNSTSKPGFAFNLFYMYTLLTDNTDISSYFWDWYNKNILHWEVLWVIQNGKCSNHQWSSSTHVTGEGLFTLICVAVLWTQKFIATWSYYITGRHHSMGFLSQIYMLRALVLQILQEQDYLLTYKLLQDHLELIFNSRRRASEYSQ